MPSIAGAISLREAFFTGALLGFALAAARFVAFPRTDPATLRALPRLAELRFRSLARLCTFDAFFRLAMVAPFGWCSATH